MTMKLFKHKNNSPFPIIIAVFAGAFALAGIALFICGIGFLMSINSRLTGTRIAKSVLCTEEEKLCPNGSYVGRTMPDCAFAACPAADSTASWKTFTDPQTGLTFKYPPTLGTKYIFANNDNWPPLISASSGAVRPQTDSAGTQYCTQPVRMINGHPYCVLEQEDGALGTTFSNYTYSLPQPAQHRTLAVSFTLGSPECGNYSEPQLSDCVNERESFDIDKLVDSIVSTVSP